MTSTAFSAPCILVVGASGELGGAIAARYARPGTVLNLWGRDHGRLQTIAGICRQRGAQTHVRSMDLRDLDAAIAAILAEDDRQPVDIAVFAAGLGDIRGPGLRLEPAELVSRLATVNYAAPAALATAIADRMAARGRGQIVLIGSAAGFHALPFATAYSSSKAGLAHFAAGLRNAVVRYGVSVTLVSPGFINTAAARRVAGPKPFVVQPDAAAARIVAAATQGKAHLVFPWPFGLLRLVDRLLPRALRDRLLAALAPPE